VCGRFTLIVPTYEMLAQALGVGTSPANAILYRPRYNIAPTDPHWVLRMRKGERELVPAKWGLVPHWAKTAADAARSINARAESVEQRPAFRDSFARRRCVVVADGFFEWQKVGKERNPLWFTPRAGGLLYMAGLDARWIDPATGEARRTFSIVTTTANDVVAQVHDRMPVLLTPDTIETWMHVEDSFGTSVTGSSTSKPSPVTDEVRALLRPAPNDHLIATPVSRHVNSVRNDDPGCVAPLDDRSAPMELSRVPESRAKPLGMGETASLFPIDTLGALAEKKARPNARRRAVRS